MFYKYLQNSSGSTNIKFMINIGNNKYVYYIETYAYLYTYNAMLA